MGMVVDGTEVGTMDAIPRHLESKPLVKRTLHEALGATYLAAALDLRGWIFAVQRRSAGTRSVWVLITSTDREPLLYIRELVGAGTVTQTGRVHKYSLYPAVEVLRFLGVVAPYSHSKVRLIASATKLIVLQRAYHQYRHLAGRNQEGAAAKMLEVEQEMLAAEKELDGYKRHDTDAPYVGDQGTKIDPHKETRRGRR